MLIGSGLCWLFDDIGNCVYIVFCVLNRCSVDLDLLIISLVVLGRVDGVMFGIWIVVLVLLKLILGLSVCNSIGLVWKCLLRVFFMEVKFRVFSLVCVVGVFGIGWKGLVIFLVVKV